MYIIINLPFYFLIHYLVLDFLKYKVGKKLFKKNVYVFFNFWLYVVYIIT